MGNAIRPEAIIRALSCDALFKYVLNAMTCDSDCGICGCRCQTDQIDIDDADSDCSLEIDSCCAAAHYTSTKSRDP